MTAVAESPSNATPAPASAPAGPQPIENARVMVTGASGFVGRHVVRELIARGHHPVCLVRDRTVFAEQMAGLPPDRWESVGGSLSDRESMTAAAKDTAAIIHLVGIIQEQRLKGQTFERVHVDGTKRAIEAAQAAGVRRFIHMSALGSRLNAPSRYHRTKWIAECAVRDSGLDTTIFRPSIIHGPDGEFMQMMRTFVCDAMVASFGFLPVPFPVIPYFGKGENKLQPVDVRDVATCFVGALSRPATIGRSFDLGGPEALTWKQLYQTCKDLIPCAKKWKPIVGLPVWKAKLMAKTIMKLPVLPMALRFNEGQVAMSQEDSVCDPRPAEAAFDITLRDFRTELKQYAALIS